MKCGLLGRKLGHSYSPQIHKELGEYPYDLYEKEPEQIEAFLKYGEFHGLNVTIPYKKAVIPFLDELSPQAEKLDTVNTIVRRDGKLIGHNTDYFGFQTMVTKSGLQVTGKKVLVLGSGGASNTAVAVLKELGANVIVISRSAENNYTNLHLHKDAYAIVNTTPVGMYPNTEVSPIDLTLFSHIHGVLDVIYNPARTQLLLDAEKLGIPAHNGLLMLVAQAKESAEWFTDQEIDNSKITQIHSRLSAQMNNIILIGMPGSGKSTIGKILAQKTNRAFIDSDEMIVKSAGKSIERIFSEDGEDVFRQWETTILRDLGKESGLVISTGGGCVTKSHNYNLLHQNGTIFWIQRNIHALAVDGRPLSAGGKLEEMYQVRLPMYQDFSDYVIANGTTPQEAANNIISTFEVVL